MRKKVYLELPVQSRGIGRVRDALVKYAPLSVEIVPDLHRADLTILHVVGRHDKVEAQIEWLKSRKIPYAMIQYCLRSTMQPKVQSWIDMWKDAKAVWSYYNLAEAYVQDYHNIPDQLPFYFYYSPLGVESDTFHAINNFKEFIIATCSPHYLNEGTKECHQAAQAVGRNIFHLGNDLRREGIVHATGISDEALAIYFSQCEFVSGLRRLEGFELPVIEGLMCGARPIVYDRPEMRKWFNEFAVFIQEESREKVIDSLIKVFKEGAKPVTQEELLLAKERFDWSIIIKGFWDRIL